MDYILEGFLKALNLILGFDQETWSAIETTVRVSSTSILASIVIGVPGGFALGYLDFAGKKTLRIMVDTLLALPTVFVGLLVYAFLTSRGPLGHMGMLFTLPGIAIGQTLLALPIVIALTAAAVEDMDQHLRLTLISLGVNRRQLLFSSLWEVRHSLLAAAVTAYGRVLTEVGISMMVGGNIKWHTRTITTAIALETNKGMFSMGIALGLVLLAIALIVNLSVSFLRKR